MYVHQTQAGVHARKDNALPRRPTRQQRGLLVVMGLRQRSQPVSGYPKCLVTGNNGVENGPPVTRDQASPVGRRIDNE